MYSWTKAHIKSMKIPYYSLYMDEYTLSYFLSSGVCILCAVINGFKIGWHDRAKRWIKSLYNTGRTHLVNRIWAAYGLAFQIYKKEMHSNHTMRLKVIDIIARTWPNYLVLQGHLFRTFAQIWLIQMADQFTRNRVCYLYSKPNNIFPFEVT